jgi:hypothetical protein
VLDADLARPRALEQPCKIARGLRAALRSLAQQHDLEPAPRRPLLDELPHRRVGQRAQRGLGRSDVARARDAASRVERATRGLLRLGLLGSAREEQTEEEEQRARGAHEDHEGPIGPCGDLRSADGCEGWRSEHERSALEAHGTQRWGTDVEALFPEASLCGA